MPQTVSEVLQAHSADTQKASMELLFHYLFLFNNFTTTMLSTLKIGRYIEGLLTVLIWYLSHVESI